MGKLAQSTTKYLIEASFTANGIVERPDVIGAIFGQTEGLLGQDLDLRELQRTGRIGRIEVSLEEERGKTSGRITIPSSLDASETALIAAAVETIERIGPCESYVKLRSVKDIRSVKREYVVKKAKKILAKLTGELPETSQLTERIKESVRAAEISEYKGLPAGPDVPNSNSIIVVEGRADVLNLLKNGIKNVIAVNGTTVPKEVAKLCEKKKATVFVDGDRGGDLILKELVQLTKIDHVAKAPKGKEVEELTKKEIFKALRDKTPAKKPTLKKKELDANTRKKINSMLDKMVGTRAAYVFDESMKMVGKIPLNRFNKRNKALKEGKIIILDGSIDENFLKVAESCEVSHLIANEAKENLKPKSLIIYTKSDLR